MCVCVCVCVFVCVKERERGSERKRGVPESPDLGLVKRFRGGLVFKAHRLVYHSTLGLRVIKKKKNRQL